MRRWPDEPREPVRQDVGSGNGHAEEAGLPCVSTTRKRLQVRTIQLSVQQFQGDGGKTFVRGEKRMHAKSCSEVIDFLVQVF